MLVPGIALSEMSTKLSSVVCKTLRKIAQDNHLSAHLPTPVRLRTMINTHQERWDGIRLSRAVPQRGAEARIRWPRGFDTSLHYQRIKRLLFRGRTHQRSDRVYGVARERKTERTLQWAKRKSQLPSIILETRGEGITLPLTSFEIPPLADPVREAPVEVEHQFVWT